MADLPPPAVPAVIAPAPAPAAAPGIARAAHPVATTTITTSADGLVVGWQQIPVADGSLPVYVAQPAGSGPFPVVIVVQEIFGVHEHITDVARRLAKLGYLAVAPELFFRRGDPRQAPDIETLRRDFVSPTGDAQVLADLERTLDWAVAHGGDGQRTALTGFCWGGRIAWLAAARLPRLRAIVAWYGRLDGEATTLQPSHPLALATSLTVPVLGLYGGQDQGIPVTKVEAMRSALAAANAKAEIHLYPEAPHAFFADYRPSYRPKAAADGWRRLQAWLAGHGVR